MSGRTTTATVDGRTYEIPEIWLVGFCHSNQCSVAEAVRYWAWQASLDPDGPGTCPPRST